jgi:hypothetical protein
MKRIGERAQEGVHTAGRNTTPIAERSLAVSRMLKRERIPISSEGAIPPPSPIGSVSALMGPSARLMAT